ncbi:hypothetical protein [Planococcus sp. SSTMD024]|uniref:hypothetical protein n=1 Tax=Planococcus sp. SSTMD024 TaxID=3242163 RepID=UPI00351E33DC
MTKLIMYGPFFLFALYMPIAHIALPELMLALGVIALTFIPKISKQLHKPARVKRKAKAALYTSFGLVLVPLVMSMIGQQQGIDAGALFMASHILLLFLFGNFVFSIPSSLIADWATMRAGNFRVLLAFFIHIAFGLISYLFLQAYVIFAIISAIVFFVVDEILRKRRNSEQQTEITAAPI